MYQEAASHDFRTGEVGEEGESSWRRRARGFLQYKCTQGCLGGRFLWTAAMGKWKLVFRVNFMLKTQTFPAQRHSPSASIPSDAAVRKCLKLAPLPRAVMPPHPPPPPPPPPTAPTPRPAAPASWWSQTKPTGNCCGGRVRVRLASAGPGSLCGATDSRQCHRQQKGPQSSKEL